MVASGRSRSVCMSGTLRTSARVYGCAALSSDPAGSSSTIRPPYITSTRLAGLATTLMSWLISSMAMPRLGAHLAQQGQHLPLHGHVQPGGRLVGQDDRWLAHQSHADHRALAHAAGELVRILPGPALRRGDPHRPQPVHGPLMRPPPGGSLVHLGHLGQLPAHPQGRVQRGHRVLEHHGQPGAQQRLAARGSAAPAPPGPPSSTRAARATPGWGTSPAIPAAVRLFPEPDSPTMPTISPLASSRLTPRDRGHPPGRAGELDSELVHPQRRAARGAVGSERCGRRRLLKQRGGGPARRQPPLGHPDPGYGRRCLAEQAEPGPGQHYCHTRRERGRGIGVDRRTALR